MSARIVKISKTRFDDHLSRKIFHVLSGTVVVFLFLEVLGRKQSIVLLTIGTLIGIVIDLLRISWRPLNQWILKIYGPLMRDEEQGAPSAQLFYLLGMWWAFVMLPKVIAVQAVLTLAWMDPVAGIVGVRYGKKTWNRVFTFFIPEDRRIPASLGAKTVEGSLAGFLAAAFAGLVAWSGPWAKILTADGSWVSPQWYHVLTCSVLGGLVATVAEAWPSQWDDNAKIPFWTGSVILLYVLLAGIPISFA